MAEPSRKAAHEIASFSAVIDMQKRIVLMLDSVHNRASETTQAIERMSRGLIKLQDSQVQLTAEVGAVRQEVSAARQEVGTFRQETAGRFEAAGRRFDEIDDALDRLRSDLKDARSEIVAQNLETLNAIQEAANVRIAVNELSETVQELRNRLG